MQMHCVEWKTGYATMGSEKNFLQMYMQSFLYENITNIHQPNLMQVPC